MKGFIHGLFNNSCNSISATNKTFRKTIKKDTYLNIENRCHPVNSGLSDI